MRLVCGCDVSNLSTEQITTESRFSLFEACLQRLEAVEKELDAAPQTDIQRASRMLTKLMNTLAGNVERCAAEVASHLLGFPDHYSSHGFVALYLPQFTRYLDMMVARRVSEHEQLAELNAQDAETAVRELNESLDDHAVCFWQFCCVISESQQSDADDDDMSAFETELAHTVADDDLDLGAEAAESVDADDTAAVDEDGDAAMRDARDGDDVLLQASPSGAIGHCLRLDYIMRPAELENVCLYDFVAQYHRAPMTARERANRTTMRFMQEHPHADRYVMRRRQELHVPSLIGKRDYASTTDNREYARNMMILFRPWRSLSDLWPDAFSSWVHAFNGWVTSDQFSDSASRYLGNFQVMQQGQEQRRQSDGKDSFAWTHRFGMPAVPASELQLDSLQESDLWQHDAEPVDDEARSALTFAVDISADGRTESKFTIQAVSSMQQAGLFDTDMAAETDRGLPVQLDGVMDMSYDVLAASLASRWREQLENQEALVCTAR